MGVVGNYIVPYQKRRAKAGRTFQSLYAGPSASSGSGFRLGAQTPKNWFNFDFAPVSPAYRTNSSRRSPSMNMGTSTQSPATEAAGDSSGIMLAPARFRCVVFTKATAAIITTVPASMKPSTCSFRISQPRITATMGFT
jgi:hypothetical protein